MNDSNFIINKGKNFSGPTNLNLLYKQGNCYIMDNHLAAIWCWYQELDLKSNYNLFHIDRHYDLSTVYLDQWLEILKDYDFKNNSIETLLNLKYEKENGEKLQLFNWANYLPIFNGLSKSIDFTFFATHEDGDLVYEEEKYEEIESYYLLQNIKYFIEERVKPKRKWILNIDIDYFFMDLDEESYFQFLSDEAIIILCGEIKKIFSDIQVLTIALSPCYCGGWENSLRVANLISKELGLDFHHR